MSYRIVDLTGQEIVFVIYDVNFATTDTVFVIPDGVFVMLKDFATPEAGLILPWIDFGAPRMNFEGLHPEKILPGIEKLLLQVKK